MSILGDELIFNRKLQHIKIVLTEDVDFPNNCRELYNGIKLVHQALPLVNYDDIDTRIEFLGYQLSAPIIITGMTGGHKGVTKINYELARLAEEYRIAIGVGSQRPLTIDPNNDVIESYRIVRKTAPDAPIVGNIGANTLNDLDTEKVLELISILDADALAVHLNPAQEAIQPEGDTRFSETIVDRLVDILDKSPVPIIIKEVGNGLSMETVKILAGLGVRYFDVAGACGTNWILVEKYRSENRTKKMIADLLRQWGIPTPISVIETRYTAPDSFIIASGGVWDALSAVKNLVLGADMIGFAKPILKKLIEEKTEGAKQFLNTMIDGIRTVMFLVGAKNINELYHKPVILPCSLINYMEQRGIDPKIYNEMRLKR